MTLRGKRVLLRLVVHGTVTVVALLGILLGQLSASPDTIGLFGLALLGYLVTLRINPLPGLVERNLYQEVECSSCGQVVELVNNWTCGCGFQTWQPRHGLAPCLHCHKVYDWLQCPHCDAGILT